VRQIVAMPISKDDIYEAVHTWLMESVASKRWPPASFTSGGPSQPSVEIQDPNSGKIVIKAQIWVDYSTGRHLTDFRLTALVEEGRYVVIAEDPQYWTSKGLFGKRRGSVGTIRASKGKTGPRYSEPAGWSTRAVDTEEEMRCFKAAVLEMFGAMKTGVREQVQE
jgi:hypothetical protein